MKVAILAVLCVLAAPGFARILTPDQLASELRANGIPESQIPTWQCIVQWESSYDTAAHNSNTGDHGLFQVSEIYWCTPSGTGCPNTSCDSLRNDDITNDIACAKIIYNEFQAMTGNGFEAWVAYDKHCR